MKKFWAELQDISITEWMLCMLITVLASLCAMLTWEDEDRRPLSPIFAGQAFWYFIRSVLPVYGWLKEKLQAEEEAVEEEAAEPAEAAEAAEAAPEPAAN